MENKILKETLNADGLSIAIISDVDNNNEYISLTDIAKYKNSEFPADVIKNWMRNRSTIEFLSLWEKFNNPFFKVVESDQFWTNAGSHHFVLNPQKWIETTKAIGMISKSGRSGGTFAHPDIAFEFASWISAEFKLYIIKDYQRLKIAENNKLSIDWNIKRIIAKTNYKLHTDAIKYNLIPENVSKFHQSITYASEADVLNVALFGKTAKEWRDKNPKEKGNIRDLATIQQLIVLSNLENLNAQFIKQGLPQKERLLKLNEIAIEQLRTFENNSSIKKLEQLNNELS